MSGLVIRPQAPYEFAHEVTIKRDGRYRVVSGWRVIAGGKRREKMAFWIPIHIELVEFKKRSDQLANGWVMQVPNTNNPDEIFIDGEKPGGYMVLLRRFIG